MANNDSKAGVICTLVMVAFVGTILAATCAAGSDTSAPRRALEAQGFTDIIVHSGSPAASLFGCGKDDALAYEATAKRDGRPVRLTVCCGLVFKSCTVRVP